MLKQIRIKCENTGTESEYPIGTQLHDIVKDKQIKMNGPVLGAMVNNSLKELCYAIYKPKTIRFIDYTHKDGRRMYIRSLTMVLYKAVKDVFPESELKVEHSVSRGVYCEIEGLNLDVEMHFQALIDIRKRMQEIIKADLPITREEHETTKAVEIFEKLGLHDKCTLLRTRSQMYSSVYTLDNVSDYYYGHLVPSTGYLSNFDLVKYYDGMLLILPKADKPNELEEIVLQNKMFEIFQEHKSWVKILDVPTVGSLNEVILDGKVSELIKIAEALQEKKLAQIADKIDEKRKDIKVILVSGPSSSGKTTFTKRLAIQLRVLGMKPIQISLDNYFVDRAKTPLDENGEYDFESPHALDIKLFNDQMIDLFNGKEVKLPKFSFTNGSRYYADKYLKLESNNVLIVEGIHALNPELSAFIKKENKFKVYVSALTQLGIDSHNRIPTTDNRLLRRIVRDNLYRGYSALDTLKRWSSVGHGEKKYIFPYQEEADVMFNTALLFELGVLKQFAEPLLQEVPKNIPEYAESRRLLKFLSYFVPISDMEIPFTSILREFLEGSSFDY